MVFFNGSLKVNNSRRATSFRLFQNLIAYSHMAKKITENILCRVFNRGWRHILKGLLFGVDKGWNNHLKVEALFSISNKARISTRALNQRFTEVQKFIKFQYII